MIVQDLGFRVWSRSLAPPTLDRTGSPYSKDPYTIRYPLISEAPYWEVHGTYRPFITVLGTVLVAILGHLIKGSKYNTPNPKP